MEFKKEKKNMWIYAREVGFYVIKIHLVLLLICFVLAVGFSVGMFFYGISWFSKAGLFISLFIGILLGTIIIYKKTTNSVIKHFENADNYILFEINYVDDGYFVLTNITHSNVITINIIDIKSYVKKKHTIIIRTRVNNYIYFPKTEELEAYFNKVLIK